VERIVYSQSESDIFGVKFGRYEGALEDTETLLREIREFEYDFVRLKIINADENIFVRLNELEIPYQLLGIIRQYTINVKEKTPKAIESTDIEFEPYTIDKKQLLKNLIKSSYDELPMGYFKNEVLDKFCNRSAQLENFADYIATKFTDSYIPGNCTWLIKCADEYAGCIATQFMADESYTHYIGLIPETRKKSLFYDITRFMQITTKQAGLTWASGGARLNNIASQVVFEREGCHYKHHDYIIILMPLLSLKKTEINEEDNKDINPFS
jgi:hypothetical protein